MAGAQFIVAVLDIVADSYFVPFGIFGIFMAYILFILQRIMNHNLITMYLLLSIYFTF